MQYIEESSNQTQTHLAAIKSLVDGGASHQLRQTINALRPVEIARLIESSPAPSRAILWELIDKQILGEVLEDLPEDIRAHFLKDADAEYIAELTEGLETDDLVDILQELPEAVYVEVLDAMDKQDRERIELVLNYPEDTAGGLTNTDIVSVRPRHTLEVVLRYLRRHEELPASTDNLFVVNRRNDYLGLLPISTLLTCDPSTTVREVMLSDNHPIRASEADHIVAKQFEEHDWVSAPVVDDDGKLIGRITIDDVVDVIREDADHSLMSLAGLDEEDDTFASVMHATPRRAIWLGVNLLTAILASSVINLFHDTIDKVVTLAVLMPIVASMGGVAGSQTLTLVIRGIATGTIGPTNKNWLLARELGVGILNGLLWAIIMGGIAGLWFNDPLLPMIMGAAMIINLIVAAIAGALLPSFLKSLNIDPALAGGVTLTTITDVVGFLSFLGIATLVYL
jgi:magnesium transporter